MLSSGDNLDRNGCAAPWGLETTPDSFWPLRISQLLVSSFLSSLLSSLFFPYYKIECLSGLMKQANTDQFKWCAQHGTGGGKREINKTQDLPSSGS